MHLPRHYRTVDRIPDALRVEIRGLVTGKLPWPLLIVGPVGTGKTCAALCLLDHAGGIYYTAESLVGAMTDAQFGRLTWRTEHGSVDVNPQMLLRQWESASLFVLDELGSRNQVSDPAYGAVKTVLDLRENMPLVCISNHPVEDGLSKLYDDRVGSRLSAGTVVILDGPDRRQEGNRD